MASIVICTPLGCMLVFTGMGRITASTSDESDVSLLARIRRFVAPRAETTPYVAMDASRRDVELTPVPISP